ncbi:MAG: SIMPL domain-containing protein [Chloroflexota bacterium]|nr:SIMPL domain-containing protein [Chloroflexota bacterium]
MNNRNRILPIAGALVAVTLIMAVAIGVASRSESGATAAETDATRTISVNGEGRVSLAPDVVMMSVGVDERDADLTAAQAAAAEKMDAIIAALRANGVAEDDIQTGNYSVYAERDYEREGQPVTGYVVSHTVTAKVRDIDNSGTVVAAAIDAGANNVGGIWFGLDDPAAAIEQARELAVADAEAKATDLARLANATLGPIQVISEGYAPSSPPVAYDGGGAAFDEAARSSIAPSINPGQTEVVLTVYVTYAIS